MKLSSLRPVIISVIAGISAIICVNLAVNGFIDYKQSGAGGITVTGSATRDFESDLIAWGGSFSAYGTTTKEAYDIIKNHTDIITAYLSQNGVEQDEYVFSAVRIWQKYKNEYDVYGNLLTSISDGYELTGSLTIQSNNVDNIETISRNITTLIDSGVEFISDSPEYYYTKLDELKLEMIEAATQNAEARIDKIIKSTGNKRGKLVNANLGVFQITAQNSALDEYSSSGAYNTWSRYKTAAVTVKLYYGIR